MQVGHSEVKRKSRLENVKEDTRTDAHNFASRANYTILS